MNVLVTGPAGSGKSTAYSNFSHPELEFIEGDSLAAHRNRFTGNVASDRVPAFVKWLLYPWRWDKDEIQAITNSNPVIIFGAADAALQMYQYFDVVIFLHANWQTIVNRLNNRSNQQFGKTVFDKLIVFLTFHTKMWHAHLSSKVYLVDASRDPRQVVEQISTIIEGKQ